MHWVHLESAWGLLVGLILVGLLAAAIRLGATAAWAAGLLAIVVSPRSWRMIVP